MCVRRFSLLCVVVVLCAQVLEQAVCDCERRSKLLLSDVLTAQQFERETRKALASAREAQASAERALQQQTQRLLAAERMRLSDLKVHWESLGLHWRHWRCC